MTKEERLDIRAARDKLKAEKWLKKHHVEQPKRAPRTPRAPRIVVAETTPPEEPIDTTPEVVIENAEVENVEGSRQERVPEVPNTPDVVKEKGSGFMGRLKKAITG